MSSSPLSQSHLNLFAGENLSSINAHVTQIFNQFCEPVNSVHGFLPTWTQRQGGRLGWEKVSQPSTSPTFLEERPCCRQSIIGCQRFYWFIVVQNKSVNMYTSITEVNTMPASPNRMKVKKMRRGDMNLNCFSFTPRHMICVLECLGNCLYS